MIGVNLLPAQYVAARQRRVRTRLWGVICAVHAMLVAGVGVVSATGEETSASFRAKVVIAQGRMESKTKEIDALRRTLVERSRRVEAVRAIADHPDWSILLDRLARLRGGDVVLERVVIVPETASSSTIKPGAQVRPRYQVTIEGLARSNAAVLEYALAIQRLGIFDNVRPEQTRQREMASGDLFGFQLRCDLGDATVTGATR